MRVAIFLCFALLVGSVWADNGISSRPVRSSAVLQSQPRPATKPGLVTTRVGTIAVQQAAKPQPRQGPLSEQRGVGTTLQRPGSGFTENARSAETRKPVIPGRDLSPSGPAANARIDMVQPKTGAAIDSARETPVASDSPAAARLTARKQVDQTARLRMDASSLTEESFARPADLRVHRQTVTTIETAARALETRAPALPPSDLAVAQYQIDYATRQAAEVNRAAAAGKVISVEQVKAVQTAASPVQPMTSRIMSGQRPFPVRTVNVRVGRKDASDEVAGLQVYVLPGGILDDPSLFSESEIRSYLTRFSFTQLTSPAAQEVAVFDMRVWVGPRMNYDEMVQLIGQREVKKFRVINDPTVRDQLIELAFVAPDDLVEP